MGLAANTDCLLKLENNANDSSANAYNFTNTGSAAFVTTPTPPRGAYACGGNFSAGSVYLDGPAGLRTAWAGKTAWTISGFFYLTSLTSAPAIVELYQSAGVQFWFQILNTGAARIGKNGSTFADSASGIVSINTWYHFALVGTTTNLRVSISPATAIDSTFDATLTTNATAPSPINGLRFGYFQFTGGNATAGYFDQIRYTNAAETSFPLADTFAITATASNEEEIVVSWADQPGFAYGLIKKHSSDVYASASTVGYIGDGVTSWTDYALTPGTAYYYWLDGYRSDALFMERSETATDTTDTVAAPTSLAAGTPTEEGIPLTWVDAASPATRTLIYRHTANVSGSAVLVGAVAAGTQVFTAGGLTPETLYYFWAKSLTDGGTLSSFTSSVSATTAAEAVGADTPTAFAATTIGRDSVRLTWTDGAGTSALLVLRHTADSYAGASVISGVDAGVQVFNDSGLASGTQYYYWLLPLGTSGPGTETSSVTATTYGAAGNPGDDIVSQIVTAAKTRIAAVVSSDFVQLKHVKDLKKNERVPWGWGVDLGEESPSDASVFGSYTASLALQVVLYRNPNAIQNDRDVETATLSLEQWKDRIHRDFTTTRLYENDVIVRVGDPDVAIEYLEDAEVVALRITFPVIYRNSRV